MPETENTGPTFEQLLSNLAGNEHVNPDQVAMLEHFHARIKALEKGDSELHQRTIGLMAVGGTHV